MSGERYIHPLRRYAPRPPCLRGTVCLRSERVSFPFSPFRLSHATRCGKGGCNCRQDGDYDVEDLAPSAVVVECSHFCLDYRVQSTD